MAGFPAPCSSPQRGTFFTLEEGIGTAVAVWILGTALSAVGTC